MTTLAKSESEIEEDNSRLSVGEVSLDSPAERNEVKMTAIQAKAS